MLEQGSVRSVNRAFDLLELFLECRHPIGVGEAARLSGMPKSTVFRLLRTMEGRGYLSRDEDERFLLTDRLFRTSDRQGESDLQRAAKPVLDGLRDTCGETVGLHRLEGDERHCIGAAEGVRTMHTSGRVGSRAPLYSGASSRAILAFLPTGRWEEIVQRTGLAPLTANTITDPVRLRAELGRIRTSGYAVSHGEWSDGITSVAVPLFDAVGTVVGSLNVSGPTFRFGEEKIRLMVGALKAAADSIRERLRLPAVQ